MFVHNECRFCEHVSTECIKLGYGSLEIEYADYTVGHRPKERDEKGKCVKYKK